MKPIPVKVVIEEESSTEDHGIPTEAPLDLDFAEGELLLDAPMAAGAQPGGLVTDILDTATAYSTALQGTPQKASRQQADAAPSGKLQSRHQGIQKLMAHLSGVIRLSIPFTKSLVFLDEHLDAIRTELQSANDILSSMAIQASRTDVQLTQVANICDAKISSVQSQIASLEQTRMDLLLKAVWE